MLDTELKNVISAQDAKMNALRTELLAVSTGDAAMTCPSLSEKCDGIERQLADLAHRQCISEARLCESLSTPTPTSPPLSSSASSARGSSRPSPPDQPQQDARKLVLLGFPGPLLAKDLREIGNA
eukprot:6866485-Pyramimonas_sp.AAC.1